MLDSTHLFVWAEFAAAKRVKISAIRSFKTESFNRGFYFSFIVMFDVNCFADMFADCHIATNFIAMIVERVTYSKRLC